ncbi:MAG: cbb3-type cytochrome oxidase assembly protein CcoS [Alcaligenaceae bacterium]|nr:cbb3-type cytochrome oxidase assembly protein CcoS [Alcaligenaceae bacterium]
MESLFLLLSISFLFVVGIGIALFWAVFSGQFDDTEENGQSILKDNDSHHK